MKANKSEAGNKSIQLWGGLECTVNRVLDDYFCQMKRNGHATRMDDLERFASLGIEAIRYPVLWERTAPNGIEQADWSWPDERLPVLKNLGITPIVGLVHHGSGPQHTSLVDPCFAEQLAQFAGAVAQRYPWVDYYTPVNEPLTTARFSGLYGVWYPHGKDERTFIQAFLNQCRGVVLSMRAIRAVNPVARLVQTDDISKTYSTPKMAELANFYNERRWLTWDLLCGKVGPDHPLWDYMVGTGIDSAELLWFRDNPCPPDIIGLNYYVTSERWLDQRIERYPERFRNTSSTTRFVDIEAARVLATPTAGLNLLLQETWERYQLPIAVTEAHIDANREDQIRWLLEIWQAARQAQSNGADIRAVTVWALLGSFDWNSLVTQCKGYYEPGPFDVRSTVPRPTAVATLMRELAAGKPPSHPALAGQGWWRRPGRFFCAPVATRSAVASLHLEQLPEDGAVQPILIIGATGTLGRAFARICEQRNLACRLLGRQEMDIAMRESVEQAISLYRPWAIINAGGYVNVDLAESEIERCYRDNAVGPAILADSCAKHGIQLLTFSSDLVFNGEQKVPYVESDPVAPLNHYGKSKVEAERAVLGKHPASLVVRTSAFFGPWDSANFVTLALEALGSGQPFYAAADITVSPTYVPDLVHASLDLLIDRECGIWHLTNGQALTWAELALKAANMAEVDASRLEGYAGSKMNYLAARPAYTALSSERAILLPDLDDALARYLHVQKTSGLAHSVKAIHFGS